MKVERKLGVSLFFSGGISCAGPRGRFLADVRARRLSKGGVSGFLFAGVIVCPHVADLERRTWLACVCRCVGARADRAGVAGGDDRFNPFRAAPTFWEQTIGVYVGYFFSKKNHTFKWADHNLDR